MSDLYLYWNDNDGYVTLTMLVVPINIVTEIIYYVQFVWYKHKYESIKYLQRNET